MFLEAEDTIPDGLDPGDGEENVVDGWTVRYQKYLVTVGNFRAYRSEDPATVLREEAVYVADMQRLPAGGFVLTEFDDVTAERWDHVGYDLPEATGATQAAEGTSAADHEFMIKNGYSLYIEGTITKADGKSCKPGSTSECEDAPSVSFRWGLKAGTSFDDCGNASGDRGFAVPSGGSVQVKPTVHGDHWFFTNITQGAEITQRRAQWIADSDTDHNGETTLDELRGISAASVFPAELGYNLSGSLIPIMTAYDYVEAQARTLGDFNGEGECPTREIL